MRKTIDLTGNQFGKLTVLTYANKDKSGVSMWLCSCECGTEKVIRSNALRSGRTQSCGCMSGAKHGHRRTKETSPSYISWLSMQRRCNNPGDAYYADYGGRGITVCARWGNFEAFLKDMGERPTGHTLDRIDVDKGYSPNNCRWATPKDQARNRRNNHMLDTPAGRMCITKAAETYGVKVKTIAHRLSRGWSVEKALLTQPWQGNNE
ncbi:hypothetical protein ACLB5K_004550 [Enterobacter hormaechei]|uniref:HNH endonuclease n=1 Tax=Enterobacter hormaechei subsp. xiangfangensis TaxID=1296536 RepID=A0A837F9M9_9ENTR|nr:MULTISPECIES: hypothetical protein [Enterobacter cloacae complex]EKS6535836.1 hypothetical protein [Enterobacter hormaechei]EKS6540625.1 hypothetical protein [Enterobacter hormaechei]EKS6551252.1 hypothetical protein [Enterobacter hormaechei]EKT5041802.1 hypothetical protein [Enterobacter hormaechei]EKY3901211.1 hypothetical protein [Enterobacter hormaechei]